MEPILFYGPIPLLHRKRGILKIVLTERKVLVHHQKYTIHVGYNWPNRYPLSA